MIAPTKSPKIASGAASRFRRGPSLRQAVARWRGFTHGDADAVFDREYRFDAADIAPMITYGTNPGMGMAVVRTIPADADSKAGVGIHGFNPGADVGQSGRLCFSSAVAPTAVSRTCAVSPVWSRTPQDRQHHRGSSPVRRASKPPPRPRGWTILAAAGFELPPAGLFGVSGDECRQDSRPGKYSVSTLEPQFRGGSRVPAPVRCCRAWPLPPPPAVTGGFAIPREVFDVKDSRYVNTQIRDFSLRGRACRGGKHRYRPDHQRALSESHRTQGFGDNLFRDWRYDAAGRGSRRSR